MVRAHGLTTSPDEWARYRDRVLKGQSKFVGQAKTGRFETWLEKTKEQNLWKIKTKWMDLGEEVDATAHIAVDTDGGIIQRGIYILSEPEWCSGLGKLQTPCMRVRMERHHVGRNFGERVLERAG